jgi:hypothetical protein
MTIGHDLAQVRDKAILALQMTEADTTASPVLTAVVREFANKATKALDLAGTQRDREAVVELEQAGDSAKVAAEASEGLSERTASSIQDAHLSICMLKAQLRQPVS